MDILTPKEFGVKWKGRYLRPSRHAFHEMVCLGMDLYDIVEILDAGMETGNPRAKCTVERYILQGRKIIRVVVIESYAHDIEEWVWLVKHVGGR
jgi:hypothetical protein